MITIRRSPATERNGQIAEREAGDLSNRAWLADGRIRDGVILLGGSSVVDFRLRVAQSHLRIDLTPSCWSIAGILLDDETFASVPFGVPDASTVPRTNAVQRCRLADYDDPRRFPNIAVVQFADGEAAIRRNVDLITSERSIIDLPAYLVPWLAFVWGAGLQPNPLFEQKGIPSAVFVETAYAIAGVELTPGLSSASSCPEAIWQSATWWQAFFESATGRADEKRAVPIVPRGEFVLRQPAAAVLDEPPGVSVEPGAPTPAAEARGRRATTRGRGKRARAGRR
jgi:hypothetical protein